MYDSKLQDSSAGRTSEIDRDGISPGKMTMSSPWIVQRKAGGDAGPTAERTASGNGKPLSGAVRKKMEQAFHTDFSAVRVFEGLDAAEIGALAFTRGTDIFFAPGRYQPETTEGQKLLGHELAHVVQQSQGRVQATAQAKGVAINDDPSLEREADEQGELAASGDTAFVSALFSGAAVGSHVVSQAKCDSCGGTGSQATEEPPLLSDDLATTGEGCTTCGGSGTVQAKAETHPVQELHGSSGLVAQRAPGNRLKAPGTCSWFKYNLIDKAVKDAVAEVKRLGGCREKDTCEQLAAKIAAITTEIAARVAINATCFKGGDDGHREQVQLKIAALNNCYKLFSKQFCDDDLKRNAFRAVEAARRAGDATIEAARNAANAAGSVLGPAGSVVANIAYGLAVALQFLIGDAWQTP